MEKIILSFALLIAAEMKKRGSSFFKNTDRIDKIHAAIIAGDRDALDAVIQDRKENAQVYKKIKGKNVVWDDLKVFKHSIHCLYAVCAITHL